MTRLPADMTTLLPVPRFRATGRVAGFGVAVVLLGFVVAAAGVHAADLPRNLSARPANEDGPLPDEPVRVATDPLRKKPGQILRTSADDRSVAEVNFDDPIIAVRVEGNDTIPVREIEKQIKVRPGRPATLRDIKQDVDALVRTRWFVAVEPYVRPGDEGLILIYRVLERPIVRSVEYQGNKKIKTKVFEGLTNLKAGSPFDVSANQECARRIEAHYHEKGYAFATVELVRGGDREDREVVFKINEGPKVGVDGMSFEGNEFFSDNILKLKKRSKLRFLHLFGGKYDPSTIPDDVEAFRQYYHSLGFFEVEIDHRVDFNKDKSSAKLVYIINEGPRFKLRNITVMGNDVLTEQRIRQNIRFRPGDYYNARDITEDMDKIRGIYGEQGRLFASVDAVPQFLEQPGELDLEVRINEDKIYVVREFRVHIDGDYPHTRENLPRNISRIHPGDLADPKKIKKTESQLAGSQYFEADQNNRPRLEVSKVNERDWITDQSLVSTNPRSTSVRGQTETVSTTGYAPAIGGHSQVGSAPSQESFRKRTPPATPGTVSKSTDYFVRANPGLIDAIVHEDKPQGDAPDTPNAPTIRGQTRDMREPQQYPYQDSPRGDPFGHPFTDPPDVWETMPAPEYIDIDAYLKEARTGRLMFGVGVNSNAGLVGNIVLSESNFDIMRPPTSLEDIMNGTAWRGAGQKFRIEAMPGTQVSRYTVDLQDPYFLDTDFNAGISGFYYQRYLEFWSEERYGGRIRVGKQLTPEWSTSAALRLEEVTLYNAPSAAPPILAKSVGDNFLSTVRLQLSHDTRDSAFMPGEGHFIEFAYEQAFGNFNYPKGEIDAWQYWTTYRRPDGFGKHILSLHGNIGVTAGNTPIFERYYAGGYQSFRGYYYRGVSPIESGVRVGGDFMALGSIEYNLPVLASEALRLVAFSDFGTIGSDVSLDNFRLSVGGGMRITIPAMGPAPIALDFAVPVIKTSYDREQLFSFYVGFNR